MRKSYFAITLLAILTLVAGLAFGQGQGGGNIQNNNASLGTKALLARIEALETIVASLIDDETQSSDVAGSVYRTHHQRSALTAVQTEASRHLVSTGIRTMEFNEDGTGTWTTLACGLGLLSLTPTALQQVTYVAPGCDGGSLPVITFTYTQTGNEVEVTMNEGLIPFAIFSVSNDGNTIVSAQFEERIFSGNVLKTIASTLFTGVRISE